MTRITPDPQSDIASELGTGGALDAALSNAYVQQVLFPQATADELDNGLAPSHRVLDAGYAHNDVAGNLVIGTARVPALSPVYMTQAAYDASAPHDPFVAYIIVTS